MRYRRLGSSDLSVSQACLGSMTWGSQNTQAEAEAQIEFALAAGVNFIDTAELYAVPPTVDSYGKTETIIGNWLGVNSGRREQIILASKIAGNGLPWIRQGTDIDGQSVIASVEASLKRLQTDYLDLYQLHWPNRNSPHFGKHWPGRLQFSAVSGQQHIEGMLEILRALQDCIQAGKIRHFGLSDDTPWGIHSYLRLAELHGLAKPVSIQNEFSLLHSKDWPYLIETCVHQDVAYLPWSPLGGGVLSGKYIDGQRPPGSRWKTTQRNGLFRDTDAVNQAVKAYAAIAADQQISSAQLALAWCDQVDGVTSTIIGATNLQQLEENLQAFERPLSEQTLSRINQVIHQYPMPF